jgi:hypothetical protein
MILAQNYKNRIVCLIPCLFVCSGGLVVWFYVRAWPPSSNSLHVHSTNLALRLCATTPLLFASAPQLRELTHIIGEEEE